MLIGGLQKTTLIDFPGKIACTVFLVGCNFSCPFCHNKDLVNFNLFKKSKIKPVLDKEFFEFLEKRKKILDGVCITGGEPTINKNLPRFIKKIKQLGYAVKLDTNGGNPEMLQRLVKENLVDYIAMDIKSSFDDYYQTANLKTQNLKLKTTAQNLKLINIIRKSIKIIVKSKIDFEFRTTVVPGLHTKDNLIALARQLKKLLVTCHMSHVAINWFLQPFRPQNCLDPAYLKKQPFSSKKLKEILMAVKKIFPSVKIRGED